MGKHQVWKKREDGTMELIRDEVVPDPPLTYKQIVGNKIIELQVSDDIKKILLSLLYEEEINALNADWEP